MPILVLAARLCPEGVEATLFATLMSFSNGGGWVQVQELVVCFLNPIFGSVSSPGAQVMECTRVQDPNMSICP